MFRDTVGSAAYFVAKSRRKVGRITRCADKPRFDNPANFSEGLAAIQIGNKYGYIDRAGNFAIEPVFVAANEFRGGLATVTKDEEVNRVMCCWRKWDYIDKTGKPVWEYKK